MVQCLCRNGHYSDDNQTAECSDGAKGERSRYVREDLNGWRVCGDRKIWDVWTRGLYLLRYACQCYC